MPPVQSAGVEDSLDTMIAGLVMTQQASRFSPDYRPLIVIPAIPALLAESRWPVMSADQACVEAILAAGGEVCLVPLCFPVESEHAVKESLRIVLTCDGLLFPGSFSDVDPRLYGQEPACSSTSPDPLLDRWLMLLALAAHMTLVPVFGICGGAERLNVALGGSLQQHIGGHRTTPVAAHNWIHHTLWLDAEMLARCLRGADYLPSDEEVLTVAEHSIACMHHQAPDRLAPQMEVWGWAGEIIEGFGYAGPQPWFALGTLFHPEAGQEPLARFLFRAFLRACKVYASSARAALRAPRLRRRMLRHLEADPLVQQVLRGTTHPLPIIKTSVVLR